MDTSLKQKVDEYISKHTNNSDIYELGVWNIYGEDDSNGGIRDMPNVPFLGRYHGAYVDVLAYAISDIKRFYSYGRGEKLSNMSLQKRFL